MSRRKKRINIKVGFFVLAGIICLFSYIFLLGNNLTYFNLVSKYKVKFKSVDGLFNGSMVKVNGVPAGNVVDIHFMEETGDVQTTISILHEFTSSITDQSEATLITKGLLGDKYIYITTKGWKQGEQLKKGAYIPTKPVSGILELLGGKDTGDKVSAILDELLIFVKSLNSEKAVQQISKTAHSISNMFSEDNSKDISQSLEKLNSILTKLDKGEGTAGALINNKNLYYRVLGLFGQRPYHKYLPSLVNEKIEK